MKKSAMPDPKTLFTSYKKRKNKKKVATKQCEACNGSGGGAEGPDCKECGGSGTIVLKKK